MSFMDNLTQMAGQLFGGANAQQASTAAGEHVAGMDPNELAGHIQQSLGSLDTGNLAALGQQLLASFTAHPPAPDGPEAAVEAGTTAEAVASGSPNAISSLVDYAKSHPEVLSAASTAFMQHNPQALEQLAPGLLSGIMDRFKGGQTTAAPDAQ
jgi:hypothetical protein